jgi:hypothetical protein
MENSDLIQVSVEWCEYRLSRMCFFTWLVVIGRHDESQQTNRPWQYTLSRMLVSEHINMEGTSESGASALHASWRAQALAEKAGVRVRGFAMHDGDGNKHYLRLISSENSACAVRR